MDLIRVCRKGQTKWNSKEINFKINIIETKRNEINVEIRM